MGETKLRTSSPPLAKRSNDLSKVSKETAHSTDKSLLQQVEWITAVWVFSSLFLAMLGLLICEYNMKTFILAFVCYYIGGIGITSGYHRLWSHRSYDAVWIVRFILLIMGTGAFEGSVISWSTDHRAHHRYTDTDKDPYNAKKGFFWSHMGWLLWKREEIQTEVIDTIDISDLQKDRMLRIQHDYYLLWASLVGIFMPMFIAGYFWNDWLGGFLIGGMAKSVFLQHCTFFINSLAHTWGDATYSDQHTARDSYLVSIFTFGEGYHNFHHEFPYDYRNGLDWYHYDPGKWIIRFCNFFGLASNLKRFPPELFYKGLLNMKQKELDRLKSKYNWGKPASELPTMTYQDFKSRVKEGSQLMVIDGIVYDVTKFINDHPGGKPFVQKYLGLDATKAFNGKIYNHSQAARHLLATLSVAKIVKE